MAKPVVPLNEEKCKSLRFTQNGSNRIFDGEGLYLEVLPSGGKRWRLRYVKPDGKESLLTLGNYPEVGIRSARQMRAQVKNTDTNAPDVVAERTNTKMAATAHAAKKSTGKKPVLPSVAEAAVPNALLLPADNPLLAPAPIEPVYAEADYTVYQPHINISLHDSFAPLASTDILSSEAEFLGFGMCADPIEIPQHIELSELEESVGIEEVFGMADRLTQIEPYLSEQQLEAIASDIRAQIELQAPSVAPQNTSFAIFRSTPVLTVFALLVASIAATWYFAKTTLNADMQQKIEQLETIEQHKDMTIQQLKESQAQSVEQLEQLKGLVDQIDKSNQQKQHLEQGLR